MMATKQLLPNQCNLLHQFWPNDCCICDLRAQLRQAEEQIRWLPEHPVARPDSSFVSKLQADIRDLEAERGRTERINYGLRHANKYLAEQGEGAFRVGLSMIRGLERERDAAIERAEAAEEWAEEQHRALERVADWDYGERNEQGEQVDYLTMIEAVEAAILLTPAEALARRGD